MEPKIGKLPDVEASYRNLSFAFVSYVPSESKLSLMIWCGWRLALRLHCL